MLHLFNRNSHLLEIYIDYYYKTFNKIYCESKVTDNIAKKNPALLLQLKNQKRISVWRLGRRTTKKVFILMKDTISQEFEKYQNLLNQAVIVRRMGDEFKNVYFKIFPKRINEITPYSRCETLLKYYPKNKKWELFCQTFHRKFPNKDPNEIFSLLGTCIKDLNPPKHVIIKWAEYKYQKNNDDSLLKYFQPTKAIPLIKEKINVTSDINKRENLVHLLLETCEENKDLTALAEVLKYVCFRHRNEEVAFRGNFLYKINNRFNLEELNETHWKCIHEQLNILKIQNEFQFWKFGKFLKKHLEFLVKNEDDLGEYLIEFMGFTITEKNCFMLELKNPQIERKLLIEIIRIFPDIIKTHPADLNRQSHMTLISSIIKFSEKYPNYFIDLGECTYLKNFLNEEITKYLLNNDLDGVTNLFRLIANVLSYKKKFTQTSLLANDSETVLIIKKVCQNGGYYLLCDCIKSFILKRARNDFENQLLCSYFTVINVDQADMSIVNWFLENDPRVLIPYFNGICEQIPKFNVKLMKLYSHLNFDKELISIYKTKLESNNTDYFPVIVEALRILLSANDFKTLIMGKFVPTKPKLDLEDKRMKKLYDIQCKMAGKLHKLEEPLKILLLVLKFCVGDYLQSALPALQGVFYRSPEKELYSHMDKLSENAVSIRKHAVFLSCELLNQEYIMHILTTTEESNISSQKHLFSATLKYFKKNPSQELLNLVVKNMSAIDKNDDETLESLVSVTVPRKYKGFYIEKCWELYESMKSNGVNVDKYLENLLQTVLKHTDILISLPLSFLENIINNYFCTTFNPHVVRSFIINFLINVKNFSDKYFVAVLKKLTTVEKRDIKDFIDTLKNSELSERFLITFAKHWNEQFSLIDAFEEHIMIKLLLLDFAPGESSQNLAESITVYMDDLIRTFTFNAFTLFVDVFRQYISRKVDHEQYKLLYELIKNKPSSSTVCILILSVMDFIDDDENEHFELFQKIMDNIRQIQEPIIIIYYKKYLAEHNSE